MTASLYIVGASLELVGIVLVASPDLVPGARRLSRWVCPRWRAFEGRLRRLLRLRGRDITVNVEAAGAMALTGSASLMTSVDPDATTERKLEFLVQRDQEAQRDMNELTERVAMIERESPKALDELRARMETHVSSELAAGLAEYRPARIVGTVALTAGLALTTAGNFVG